MRHMNKLIVMLCLSGMLATTASAYKWGKVTDEDKAITAPADYPEANAVIIIDTADMKITMDAIETRHYVRIKILTPAGVDEAGNRTITYLPGSEKIKGFQAQTITPKGKKIKVKKDAIFTKRVGEFREKTFTFPALEPGAILEYKYRVLSDSYRYLEPWFFQNDLYTMVSTFSVTLPEGFIYNVAFHNVPRHKRKAAVKEKPVLNSSGTGMTKIRTFTWSMENLPPIKDEPFMGSVDNYRSSLRFQLLSYQDAYNKVTFVKNWADIGNQVQTFLDDVCNKKGEIKKLAQQVTAGASLPLAKSLALYAYVTDSFKTNYDYQHYLFRHEKLSGLLEEKVGTPEEKNLLLCQMHKAVGIKAWPVLISTRAHGFFDPNNADMRQFDYLLAYVEFDEGGRYLDATSHYAPYGVLPPSCLTNGGLLIDGKNSELVRVLSVEVDSRRVDHTKVYVAGDSVRCHTSCLLSGYFASKFSRLYERSTPEEFVKKRVLDKCGHEYTLHDYTCTTDTTGDFEVTADFTCGDLTEKLDNNLLVSPLTFYFASNPFKSESRFFPVDFTFPFTYSNIVEVFVGDTADSTLMPEDISLEIPGASFVRECGRTDSSLVVASRLTVSQAQFDPRDYKKLRRFFDEVAGSNEEQVTVMLATGE